MSTIVDIRRLKVNMPKKENCDGYHPPDCTSISPMQPPSGATHHRPTVDIFKYYNSNVLELSVTTLDVLLSHTFIPPSHSNPFTSLFNA